MIRRTLRAIGGAITRLAGQANVRRYAAAALNRLTDGWQTTREQIANELRRDLDALRHRARDLENNNDFAARYLRMCEINIIGDTLPRLVSAAALPDGKPDTIARAALESAWLDWARPENCTIAGHQSLRELCCSIIRGTARDGEYLLAERIGAGAGPYGYQLQVIDVDRIDTRLIRDAAPGLNAIINGVEIDADGRPIAYWLRPVTATTTAHNSERFAADTLVHRFRYRRAGQTRGVTWMHAAMLSMHHAGEFALSALMAARHGADRIGFFVTKDGAAPAIGQTDDTGATINTSQPLGWDTLPQGVEAQVINDKYPNEVFDPFIRSAIRRMASGLNVSYPALSNDHADLNYNSIRATQADDRDSWRTLQSWFAETWLDYLYGRWLRFALLAGAITGPDGKPLKVSSIAQYRRATWQFRGWTSNDPLKDANADLTNIRAGLDSATAVVARRGRDIEDVLQERAYERELADRLGVPLDIGAVFDDTNNMQKE